MIDSSGVRDRGAFVGFVFVFACGPSVDWRNVVECDFDFCEILRGFLGKIVLCWHRKLLAVSKNAVLIMNFPTMNAGNRKLLKPQRRRSEEPAERR